MIGVVAPIVALEIPVEVTVHGLSTICFHPGGQGTHTVRAIREMGEEAVLVAFNGGESGTVFRAMLDAYGIQHQLVQMSAPTATTLKLTVNYREDQVFQFPPPRVSRHESDDLYSIASLLTMDCNVMVFQGTAVEGMPADFFPGLLRHANNHGVKTVVDLEPDLMLSVLDAQPTVIKPNIDQLRRVFDLSDSPSDKELLRLADVLRNRGAKNVVISLGASGAITVGEGFALKMIAPRVEAVVESGAGDCTVATLAAGLARQMPFVEAARLGMAAGCATVLRHGLGTCRRDITERLVSRVQVVNIDTEVA